MEKELYRISVRDLVEFLLRSGDLDSRGGSFDKEAMQKGSILHRKLQKQKDHRYHAEAALKKDTEFDDMIIRVEGRADGIFEEDALTWIEEIKGIRQSPQHLCESVPVHLAQAKCYAAIHVQDEGLSRIGIRMTYAQLDTEEIRYFTSEYQAEELVTWFSDLVEEWHKWLSERKKQILLRNQSAGELPFPFPYREGQRKIVSSVYHTIHAKKQIFIQAPTGIGKTMSAVFPAVRCLGEGAADTIFYLTAKTITRTVAAEAIQILAGEGLKIRSVTLTAKERICIADRPECVPENCPRAEGHFDRINEALFSLLQEEGPFDRERILQQAERFCVCPYELSLELTAWCDIVICDYNYVFDPDVRLKRFFGEGKSGKYIFLIDEAHNLAERGREMYSARLSREDILEARKMTKGRYRKLHRQLTKINSVLLSLEKEEEDFRVLPDAGMLPLLVQNACLETEKLLSEPENRDFPAELLECYFRLRTFRNIADLLDENYAVYMEKGGARKTAVRLYCVNPAHNLQERLDTGTAAVFFSATLLPMDYYKHLLSERTDDYRLYAVSPFPAERRRILVGYDVSTVYRKRGYEAYHRIAAYIAGVLRMKKGNYMIFFPSYQMLQEVSRIYEEEFSAGGADCIFQKSEMSESEREAFLEEFSRKDRTLAAFCIMGGIFAEGIDLIGEKLIGAVLVGTGIPQVSHERELLKDYFTKKQRDGFDYAYRCPGMTRVLQAAGRVIRTYSDEGIILLLDERFTRREYARLMPEEWSDRRHCTIGTLEQELSAFWKSRNAPESCPGEAALEEG